MGGNSPARSDGLADRAEVTYEIAMPFESKNAKIHLIDQDNDGVEVLIADIPAPASYNTDRNYPDLLEKEEKMREHAIARWILRDSARVLDEYGWTTSDYKSHKPNYYLSDVYFTVDRDELDDAVFAAKQFLASLEENVLNHTREFDGTVPESPSQHFD